MTRRFRRLEGSEFALLLADLPIGRTVTEVHLHHTWKPRQVDYDENDGERTILGMWRYHTQTRGFADIAQHVTVAPDGAVWLGRSFDRPPASAIGFNGNRTAGPFMIEMIGDFDRGRETPTERQMEATLLVTRAVQARFGLPASALRFHNEMSGKTCPGDSMDKAAIIAKVDKVELPATRSAGVFGIDATRIHEALRYMLPNDDREDREPAELDHGATEEPTSRGRASDPRGLFTSAERGQRIARWRDHWISLEGGQFSKSGALRSTQADVDRIFKERLPTAIGRAKDRREPLRLMVYAHGGLVPESDGVDGMLDQIETWDDNGVYPLFFIWETGFFASLLGPLSALGARGSFTDRLAEGLARHGGGRLAWRGMKESARAANTDQGGALAVKRALRTFVAEAGDDISINLVGHSAGSIFHAHFVEDLANERKKTELAVDNLILLAPAIRTDAFRQLVLPRMNDKLVKRTTIFTMNDALERMDPTVPAYSKSLLYLISRALEAEDDADILGLEISLRGDAELARAFGLNGTKSEHAVVFSGDPGTDGEDAEKRGRASTSRTHGGFDNDGPTMNSALRIVLGRTAGEPIVPFPQTRGTRAMGDYVLEDFLPDGLRDRLAELSMAPSRSNDPLRRDRALSKDQSSLAAPEVKSATLRRGRRAALCIGINDYRGLNQLRGCIADATAWASALDGFGYKVAVVSQDEATGTGMLQRIGNFLYDARPGDDLVLQFAGHGVGFDDATGDEKDAKDEAICGIDFNVGDPGFVLDDEIRAIYAALPDGVEVTSFIDCCHSGTMTRMAIASRDAGRQQHEDLRARHADRIEPIALNAHRRLADGLGRSASVLRGIHFGACLDTQLANESRGQGHFTLAAMAALKEGGRPTNAEFMERVASTIKTLPLQTPMLYTASELRSAPFSVLL